MAKLVIKIDRNAEQILAARAQRLKPTGSPIRLTPLQQAVQFLRGVHSCATLTLPAFYFHLGSTAKGEPPCSIAGYPGLILKHSLHFLQLERSLFRVVKAFDHAAKV
jgi:hypothetical protein